MVVSDLVVRWVIFSFIFVIFFLLCVLGVFLMDVYLLKIKDGYEDYMVCISFFIFWFLCC